MKVFICVSHLQLVLFAYSCNAFSVVVDKAVRQGSSALPSTWRNGGSFGFTTMSTTKTAIHSTPPGGVDGARYSFVEGEAFDDRLAEIEAMGGDPFFMDEDGEDNNQQVKMPEDQSTPIIPGNALLSSLIVTASSRTVTDGKGPSQTGDEKSFETEDPNWEWDGTVDEDAHLD